MPNRIEIKVGDRFGRFTVLGEAPPIVFASGTKRQLFCRCDCGTEQPVTRQSLMNGRSQSCGCLRSELSSVRSMKHGHSIGGRRSPEHCAWHAILQRCHNPKSKRYAEWGGRGIKVCERWRHSFENFLADMGLKPTKRHTIDRHPDNDGDYCPENCRWATNKEQCNNKRNNHLITFRGKTQTLMQWSEELGINYGTLADRLKYNGWDLERAMTEQVMSLQQRLRKRRGTPETDPQRKTP